MAPRHELPSLIIAEPRDALREIWLDVFRETSAVRIQNLAGADLNRVDEIDCIVVTNWVAGEVFCGTAPNVRDVQFCSTSRVKAKDPSFRPAYVVSVVAFPMEWFEELGFARAMEHNWTRILQRVLAHNQLSAQEPITCLGAPGELLVWNSVAEQDMRACVEVIRRVYLGR